MVKSSGESRNKSQGPSEKEIPICKKIVGEPILGEVVWKRAQRAYQIIKLLSKWWGKIPGCVGYFTEKRLIKRDQKWTTAFLLEKRLFFHIEHEQRIKDCNLFKNFKHGLINKISSLVYNEYWIWNISCSKSMAGITILKMNFFQSFWIINASSSVDTDDKIWTLFILIKNLIISYFFLFVMDFFFFQDETQGPSNQELSNSTLFFWYFLGSCWLAPGLSSGHIALRRKIFCLKKRISAMTQFVAWKTYTKQEPKQDVAELWFELQSWRTLNNSETLHFWPLVYKAKMCLQSL